MARGGVVFELERFGWCAGAPVLEVVGRWRGPRPRRLGAAALVVLGPDRRCLTPTTTTGDPRADPDPELWRAEFLWTGSAEVEGAELEVGPSLVIELPAPDGIPTGGSVAAAQPPPADPRQLELDGLRRQAEADRAEAERLRQAVASLRRDTEEALPAVRDELEAARAELGRREERAAALEASLAAAREDVDSREKQAVAAAERRAEGLTRERDDARAELGRLGRELAVAHQTVERLARERDGEAAAVARLQDELEAARRPEPEPSVTEEVPALQPEPEPPPPEPEPQREPEPPPPDPTATLDEPPAGPAPATAAARAADPTPRQPAKAPRARQDRPPVPIYRTPPASRRLAVPPPRGSVALRAVAGAFVVLLAIVLLVIFVIVA